MNESSKECVFVVNTEDNVTVVLYDIEGNEVEADPYPAAKVVFVGGVPKKHFITVDNVGEPFDPTESDIRQPDLDSTDSRRFKFHAVSPLLFDNFIQFLQTKRRGYLDNVRREIAYTYG